jgi:predicted acetyltransferase
MGYSSPEALRAIFSFIRMFEGQYDDVEFSNLAPCPEVDLMLRHYTHTSYTVVPDVMAKTLNTEKMLLAADYPNREGGFTVKVVDPMPSVDGTFKVSYGGGDCRVERVDSTPDLTLDAPVFTRFIYGYDGVSAEVAKYMEGVEINGDADGFFTAFPKKPCGIFEHF